MALLLGASAIIFASSVSLDGRAPFESVANAEPKKKTRSAKNVARCVRYGQTLGEDKASVDISLRNRCRVPVSCSVEWKVSCDGEEGEAREFADSINLEKGARGVLSASAALCGDEGWAVEDIKWECEPL